MINHMELTLQFFDNHARENGNQDNQDNGIDPNNEERVYCCDCTQGLGNFYVAIRWIPICNANDIFLTDICLCVGYLALSGTMAWELICASNIVQRDTFVIVKSGCVSLIHIIMGYIYD